MKTLFTSYLGQETGKSLSTYHSSRQLLPSRQLYDIFEADEENEDTTTLVDNNYKRFSLLLETIFEVKEEEEQEEDE